MEGLKLLKKGDEILFTYRVDDNYRGILHKKLKYKFVVNVFEVNGRLRQMETLDFQNDSLRLVGSYLKPNSTPEALALRDRICAEINELNELNGVVYQKINEPLKKQYIKRPVLWKGI